MQTTQSTTTKRMRSTRRRKQTMSRLNSSQWQGGGEAKDQEQKRPAKIYAYWPRRQARRASVTEGPKRQEEQMSLRPADHHQKDQWATKGTKYCHLTAGPMMREWVEKTAMRRATMKREQMRSPESMTQTSERRPPTRTSRKGEPPTQRVSEAKACVWSRPHHGRWQWAQAEGWH